MFFADTMMFYHLIKKSTGKRRFGLSFKVSAIGRYVDNITPFSVGGQPSQIVCLTKAKMSPGVATSIPIIRLIIYNICYTLVLTTFLLIGMPFLPKETALIEFFKIFLKILAVLGLFITIMSSVLFILIGSGKIIGRSMVRRIVRIGYKMHLVKDYRKAYNKIMSQVLEYQSSMKYLRNNKGTLFACVFYGIIQALAFFAMPFVIVMALTTSPVTTFPLIMEMLFVCIVKFMVCQMASVVNPLPGGTGLMEISFAILFGSGAVLGNYFAIGLLAWRFLTFYSIILQGFIVSSIDSLCRVVKAKKTKQLNSEKTNENNNYS